MNLSNDFEPISVFELTSRLANDITRLDAPMMVDSDSSLNYEAMIEPTPIDPSRVVPVEQVSLSSASWQGDRSFLATLRDILVA